MPTAFKRFALRSKVAQQEWLGWLLKVAPIRARGQPLAALGIVQVGRSTVAHCSPLTIVNTPALVGGAGSCFGGIAPAAAICKGAAGRFQASGAPCDKLPLNRCQAAGVQREHELAGELGVQMARGVVDGVEQAATPGDRRGADGQEAPACWRARQGDAL
jgi:hypothetical protein